MDNEFRPPSSSLPRSRSSAARVKRMASATSEAKMTVAIVSGSGISWVAPTVAAAIFRCPVAECENLAGYPVGAVEQVSGGGH